MSGCCPAIGSMDAQLPAALVSGCISLSVLISSPTLRCYLQRRRLLAQPDDDATPSHNVAFGGLARFAGKMKSLWTGTPSGMQYCNLNGNSNSQACELQLAQA